MPKVFFATDLHGSEVCWKKFLNAAKFYGADILICGGDMTGKAIVPIVAENGHYTVTLGGEQQAVTEIGRAQSELQSQSNLVCRLLLEKKTNTYYIRLS